MEWFLLGLVAGVLIGGFVIDIDLRAPAPVRRWLASWFPKDDEPTA